MNKTTKSISINILSALIILTTLLLGVVQPVNAWFTSAHKNGVQIVVDIGDLKLKLYQNSITDENEIITNADNEKNKTADYVQLSGEVVPDTPVNLTLILANKDAGSASMYVRYKFELYVRGTTENTLLESTSISGFVAKSSEQKGFELNEEDGYYYYKETTGANALFAKGTEATILTSFTVPYSEFVDEKGNMILNGSETIYIKLIIDASVSSTFAS